MSVKSVIKRTLLGEPGERVRTVRGGVMRGYKFPIDTNVMGQRLFGFWEREIASHMRSMAKRAHTVCDVGSAGGWYTIYFASRPNVERVYAVEADETLIPIIRNNLALNSPAFVEKTTLLCTFASDKTDAQHTRLDSVLAGATRPILFKIDVDGGEMDVLRGARETLSAGNCLLIVETHALELEESCIQFLHDLGYWTRIIKNAWYRVVLPESRNIPHNRWFIAGRD